MDTPSPPSSLDWFKQARFGLFIHWGLYTLGARREWLQHQEQIPEDVYEARYFTRFDPDLYDPALWAKAADDAGMKYVVATAKHHEGFCLWDSKLTDYNACHTPAGRDLLRPLLSAFRDRALRTGLYYSLIDWHHPHFHVDTHAGPYRKARNIAEINRDRERDKYARYLHGQVRELLTEFGPIDLFWFDFSYPRDDGSGKGREDWQSVELVRLIRELQPNILLNDRLDLLDDPTGWDFRTVEQVQPRVPLQQNGGLVPWEACHTLTGSWGYRRDDANWKSPEQVIALLVDCVSKGGNLLLNVGPTGRGEFDERSLSVLSAVGAWMNRHGRSIYNCGIAPGEWRSPPDCRLTYDAQKRRLYLHVQSWPPVEMLVECPAEQVEYAQLLQDGSELLFTKLPSDSGILLKLPVERPNGLMPVIELFLK